MSNLFVLLFQYLPKNLDSTHLGRLSHPHPILALKLRAELLKVLPDLLLLLSGEQCWRPRAPQEVAEPVHVVALDDLALERPDPVASVHLQQAHKYKNCCLHLV